MFRARAESGRVALGFYEPESRRLVDILECPVLVPALARLIGPLKVQLAQILEPAETAELHATATETGVDLSLKVKRARGPDLLMALSELASALNLARLNWNGETVAMAATPSMSIGRFTVALPPESFLQPTKEGEAILQELVGEGAGRARRIADLFSGCGTFALALAEDAPSTRSIAREHRSKLLRRPRRRAVSISPRRRGTCFADHCSYPSSRASMRWCSIRRAPVRRRRCRLWRSLRSPLCSMCRAIPRALRATRASLSMAAIA